MFAFITPRLPDVATMSSSQVVSPSGSTSSTLSSASGSAYSAALGSHESSSSSVSSLASTQESNLKERDRRDAIEAARQWLLSSNAHLGMIKVALDERRTFKRLYCPGEDRAAVATRSAPSSPTLNAATFVDAPSNAPAAAIEPASSKLCRDRRTSIASVPDVSQRAQAGLDLHALSALTSGSLSRPASR